MVDISKCDPSLSEQRSEENSELKRRHDEIISICKMLSESTQEIFSVSETYQAVCKYVEGNRRWFYSDISRYLFARTDDERATFNTNLQHLQDYAYSLSKTAENRKLLDIIDKLRDHADLVQVQTTSLHDSEEVFSSRFNKNMMPFKSEFTREMHSQFISLVAIFTALSFIVFGGISSLDNIFSSADGIPIIELIIVGCVWSLCISNLVFVFMFFISKMTNISIKSSNKEDASVSEKYPFIIWCNFIILLIFLVTCWVNYIDYSNSGGWFLALTRDNQTIVSMAGLVVIAIIFSIIAVTLIKAPWHKTGNKK